MLCVDSSQCHHLPLSRDRGFLAKAEYRTLPSSLTEVRKMLTSLLQKIESERIMGNAICQLLNAD